jgi:esterase
MTLATPDDSTMEHAHTLAMRDGAAIVYRLSTAGLDRARVIVLLHGLASNMTRWSEFAEQTTLKQRFNMMRLDLRGHGESFTRGRVGMRIWCEDLLTLLDHEKYDRAILVGHSLGAQVALHFAVRYPERTAGLVLLDPVLREALRPRWRLIAWISPLAWLLIASIRLLNRLGLRRRRIPNRDLRRLDEVTRAKLLNQGRQEDMIARYSSPWPDLEHFPTANYIQEYLELLRAVPSFKTITAPVLMLLSSGITFTDIGSMRTTANALRDCEVQLVRAYHWPLTENPVGVREAIERWIERRIT